MRFMHQSRALASVTSIFGTRPDPDAERFKVLMGYLDKQFKNINVKLDRIIENQVRILKAVSTLAQEKQKGFAKVDRTLARMEFEQNRLSSGIRALIWNDWKNCFAVYAKATERDQSGSFRFIDPATQYIHSEAFLKTIISVSGEGSILPCITAMQGNLSSINAVERFGNFVDLRWVVDNRLVNAIPPELNTAESEVDEWRSRLQVYEEDVFEPAKLFATQFVIGNSIGRSQLAPEVFGRLLLDRSRYR